MKVSRLLITVFLFLIFLITPVFSQHTLIKAGKLVDPESGNVEKDVRILINGNFITAVGKDIKVPDDAEIIDLSGMTILPGLIDCHTHLCEMIRADGNIGLSFRAHYLNNTTVDRALQGVATARSFLESGFTTIRDVGNAGFYADVSLKRAIRRGLFPGPTTLVTGKIIAPFGGQHHVNPEQRDYPKMDYIYADTREEILKGIRENVHFGADWIKIVVDDQRYIYSADDIRFIVEESANAGLKVCAHCVTERGARNAVEGGVASIEHGFIMSDELLIAAKEKGVWLCGTDFSREVWDVYRQPQMYNVIVDRLKRAYRIGVKMAFGSDLVIEVPGFTRGEAALTLLDTWADADVPALDILRAFTINGAKLLEIDRRCGLVKKGQIADIIAVPEDPLENIKTLKEVKFVMRNGKVFKNLK